MKITTIAKIFTKKSKFFFSLCFSIFIVLEFQSCSNGFRKRNLDNYYIGDGIEKFFLPDVPDWINFSQTAQCNFAKRTRYLNFQSLANAYNLTYDKMIQLQLMINKELNQREYLSLQDEAYLFYNVYDKAQAGTKEFIPPTFKRINLIWVDDFVTEVRPLAELQKLMSSKAMEEGHPVFVSLCLAQTELDSYINKFGFNNSSVIGLSREMFTPYDATFKRLPKMSLSFGQVFNADQVLYFYSPRTYLPSEFTGKFQVVNF
ncbi:MAG: hypothetical protein JNM93_14065 [Bacteriovoracaceae bacterium]|nr:hypothetical protein [Bacteriovoracaceae bacterium]